MIIISTTYNAKCLSNYEEFIWVTEHSKDELMDAEGQLWTVC